MDDILLKFIKSGLPVLPVTNDKKPMIFTHKFLDNELPTEDTYKNINKCNYAIKTGNLQTKIECIDFDLKNDPDKNNPDKNIFERFKKLCDTSGLYIESTPSGGYHIIYRTYIVDGSKKLAFCKGKIEAVIETRGSGGYVVVAPSKGYSTIQGDIFTLPIIEMDRVEQIKTTCAALNERPDKSIKKQQQTIYSKLYNKKNSGEVLNKLYAEGWSAYKEFTDKIWLSRPGKANCVSGTIYKESGVFYCFTSSTQYNPSTAYSPYAITMAQKKYTDEQMEREVCTEIGEKYIKDLINELLKNEMKLKDFEIKKELNKIVIDDMVKNGKFYHTIKNGFRGFYLYEKNLYHCNIDNQDFCCLMYVLYGLTKTEGYCKKLYEDIKNYSLSSGSIVDIHNYSYYFDSVVYIDNFDGTMFKITDKDIDIVDNGSDGIIFVKSNNTPIVYNPQDIDILDEVFGEIVFSKGDITEIEYKALFMYWFIGIFFMTLNKPICVFFGEKGSGKSFIFKKLLLLLFGNTNALKTLPEKKQDFTATITNNKIVVFDNADTNRTWLNDALATAATGGSESMRELYTTNTETTYNIDCFLGLTSRTPKFTRDDVADRMLLFPVERLEQFSSEEGIINRLIKNRDIIMSYIFNQVKFALQSINKPDLKCFSRMGSFENFCRKINSESENLFKKLVDEQKDFSSDIFSDIFFVYCREQVVNIIIKTPQELADEITDIINKKRFKYSITSHSIGFKLKKEYDFVNITKQELSGRKVQYLLNIKCDIKSQNINNY